MAAVSSNSRVVVISPELHGKLRAIRDRRRWLGMIGVAVLSLAVLLLLMLLAMLMDFLTLPGNDSWRSVLTGLPSLVALLVLVGGTWRVLLREKHLRLSAIDVDRANPELEERWLSVTESASLSTMDGKVHPAMFRQLAREASAWIPRVEPSQVVSRRGLIRICGILLAALVILFVPAIWDFQLTKVLLQRFFSPSDNIALTQIEGLSDYVVVGENESATLQAELTGRIPEQATVYLRRGPDGGKEQVTKVALHVNRDTEGVGGSRSTIAHREPDLKEAFQYRFEAGDAQSPWLPVVVAKRPVIESIRFKVTPPSYTKRPVLHRRELPSRVQVAEGSELEVAFRSQEAITECRLDISDAEPQVLTADEKGWYRWKTRVTDNLKFSPILIESHGLTNWRPQSCRIQVYRDQPPIVTVVSPSPEMAVQADDAVSVHFKASDDNAVTRAELVVFDGRLQSDGTRQELKRIPIDLGKSRGGKKIDGTVELNLSEFNLGDGQSITYAITVYDNHEGPTLDGQEPLLEETQPDDLPKRESTASDPMVAQSTAKTDMGNDPERSAAVVPSVRTDRTSPNASDMTPPVEPQEAGFSQSAEIASQSDKAATVPTDSQVAGSLTTPPQTGASELHDASSDQPELMVSATDNDVENGSQGPRESTTHDVAKSDTDGKGSDNNKTSATSREQTLTSTNQESNNTVGNALANTDRVPTKANETAFNPDSMPRRLLDIPSPQSGSSSPMQLKIDEQAGSFDGQRLEKLALAISPVLSKIDRDLRRAQELTDGVASRLENEEPWTADLQQQIKSADKLLAAGEQRAVKLQEQTAGTAYAFIGLQLSSIIQYHVPPARDALWEAQQPEMSRGERVRSAWQEITQALMKLEELTKTFQRVRREHHLAMAADKIKKMYNVFIEESMALLEPYSTRINNYERKREEFELDDEYLKRLKEVSEMRNRLQAELARLLTDDPRLMRRFMDSLMTRGDTLRDQFTLLAERQEQLAREVTAWTQIKESDRPMLIEAIRRIRDLRLSEIALLAATQNDKLTTWMPLDLSVDDPAFKELLEQSKRVASLAQELAHTDPDASPSSNDADPVEASPSEDSVSQPATLQSKRISKARDFYEENRKLDDALRRMALETQHESLADHLLRRLADVRNLTMLTSQWIQQVELVEKGEFLQEAAIEQYVLALDTEVLASRLAGLEQQLAGIAEVGSEAANTIAQKTRELLSTVDRDISSNQLAATFKLRQLQGPESVEKEDAAVAAFARAETLFDELMRTVIEELDNLPTIDPTADALDDPTLDELLAALESERLFRENLGIPNRPNNLRMIYDWLRPGGGIDAVGQTFQVQLQREARRIKRMAEEAHRKALKRALKEQAVATILEPPERTTAPRVEWNKLRSTLRDDLLQGKGELLPQEYRKSIEQYFSRISRQEGVEKAPAASDEVPDGEPE